MKLITNQITTKNVYRFVTHVIKLRMPKTSHLWCLFGDRNKLI